MEEQESMREVMELFRRAGIKPIEIDYNNPESIKWAATRIAGAVDKAINSIPKNEGDTKID